MNLSQSPDYNAPWTDSDTAMARFTKTAIAYLFSNSSGPCIEALSEQDYMDGQIIYRSRHNEQALMLSALHQTVQRHGPAQCTYRILSVGCGSGLFERPFLAELLSQGKSIEFVGIDPNETECLKAQEWCQQLQADAPEKFKFTLHSTSFENFQIDQKFDIILFIQVIFYFTDVEAAIRKANSLLTTSGLTYIGLPKRWKLNEPFAQILQRRLGKPGWFTTELEAALCQLQIPFQQNHLNFVVDITPCFQADSLLGKHLLNFILHINTEALTPLQRQLLLDYFSASSIEMPGGNILLPHAGTLFTLEQSRDLL